MRSDRRRLDELLLARATAGLEPRDGAELTRLLEAHPDVDAESYDRAAAAVCLATLDTRDMLPPSLRAKLDRQAEHFIARAGSARR